MCSNNNMNAKSDTDGLHICLLICRLRTFLSRANAGHCIYFVITRRSCRGRERDSHRGDYRVRIISSFYFRYIDPEPRFLSVIPLLFFFKEEKKRNIKIPIFVLGSPPPQNKRWALSSCSGGSQQRSRQMMMIAAIIIIRSGCAISTLVAAAAVMCFLKDEDAYGDTTISIHPAASTASHLSKLIVLLCVATCAVVWILFLFFLLFSGLPRSVSKIFPFPRLLFWSVVNAKLPLFHDLIFIFFVFFLRARLFAFVPSLGTSSNQ